MVYFYLLTTLKYRAYIVRQYVFGYCIWIPLGTLYTLNNVNTWEGAREQKEVNNKLKPINIQSKEDNFFAPAFEQLEDFELESKVLNLFL